MYVDGKWYGEWRNKQKGEGLTKVDVRPYVTTDSAKRINWKMSLKKGDILVNEMEKEINITIDIFLDRNKNWVAGFEKPWWKIIESMLKEMTQVCIAHSVRQSLVVSSPKGEIHEVFHEQLRYTPADFLSPSIFRWYPDTYVSGLAPYISCMEKKDRRRVCILFSDFLAVDTVLQQRIQGLQQKNQVFLFQIPVAATWLRHEPYFYRSNPQVHLSWSFLSVLKSGEKDL